MATVMGTVELTFSEHLLTLELEHTVDFAQPAPLDLFLLVLDLPQFIEQFGPILSFDISVQLVENIAVVPLPSAAYLFAGALAWLLLLRRRRNITPDPA